MNTQRRERVSRRYDSARMHRRNRLIFIAVLALVISAALLAGLLSGNGSHTSKPQNIGELLNGGTAQSSHAVEKNSDLDVTLLVNEEHPLPDGFAPDVTSLSGSVPVKDDSVLAATDIVRPLQKLFKAAEDAGISEMYITSGFRTLEEQIRLYEDADDRSFVQKPNCSEHQTGLAVDICSNKEWTLLNESSAAAQWLAENSWRYGFIVRYPADKVDITGIAHEPWHIRYVGKKIAKSCYKSGLCLEEYYGYSAK